MSRRARSAPRIAWPSAAALPGRPGLIPSALAQFRVWSTIVPPIDGQALTPWPVETAARRTRRPHADGRAEGRHSRDRGPRAGDRSDPVRVRSPGPPAPAPGPDAGGPGREPRRLQADGP